MYDWFAINNKYYHCYKTKKLDKTNNVHICFTNKSKYYLSHNKKKHIDRHMICSYLSSSIQITHPNYYFSTTNYHIGPSIKWWEDIGYKAQRSNVLTNTTKNLINISLKIFSKSFIHAALYMTKYMAEASSTTNMDVCVVEENEIMTTSQKKITLALVTITQNKAKSKKSLEPNGLSLWLRFKALNLITKQKEFTYEKYAKHDRAN